MEEREREKCKLNIPACKSQLTPYTAASERARGQTPLKLAVEGRNEQDVVSSGVDLADWVNTGWKKSCS